MKNGLVLEGGGMRGLFTSGVLDFFLQKDLSFQACVGVSAGACVACSYLSKQPYRGAQVNIDYMKDKRCFGFGNLIKKGTIFDYDFIFDTVAHELNPFDYDAFNKRTCDFYAVSTNIETGSPVYKKIGDIDQDADYIKASMAIPMLSYPLKVDNVSLLDGGVSDSIPIDFTLSLGLDKVIVVLTQHRNYRKGANRLLPLIRYKYKKYPNLIKLLENRHHLYNDTLDHLYQLEKAGKVFIIQPSQPIEISRLEKDQGKLLALYEQGLFEAKQIYPKLKAFLEK